MTDDVEYLANYKPDTLYVNPERMGNGAYATLLSEHETFIEEINVTERSRLALSVFYVNSRQDFNTFKLTKLTWHKTYGWRADGNIIINRFQLAHLKEFASLLSNLDFKDSAKEKISLKNLDISALSAILKTTEAVGLS